MFRSKAFAVMLALMFVVPVGMMFAAESASAVTIYDSAGPAQPGKYEDHTVNTRLYFHNTGDPVTIPNPAYGAPAPVPAQDENLTQTSYIMDTIAPPPSEDMDVPQTVTLDPFYSPSVTFTMYPVLQEDARIYSLQADLWASFYIAPLVPIEYIWLNVEVKSGSGTPIGSGRYDLSLEGLMAANVINNYEFGLSVASSEGVLVEKGDTIQATFTIGFDGIVTLLFDSADRDSNLWTRSTAVKTNTWIESTAGSEKYVFDQYAPSSQRKTVIKYLVSDAFGIDDINKDSFVAKLYNKTGSLVTWVPGESHAMTAEKISNSTYLFTNVWSYLEGQEIGSYDVKCFGNTYQLQDVSSTTKFSIGAFDFGLKMADGDSATHSVLPGESTLFTLNLINMGDSTDMYSLSYSTPGGLWSAGSGLTTSIATLAPMQTQEVKITITAPQNAVDGDKTEVTIWATSDHTSATKSLKITAQATTTPSYGADISSASSSKSVRPGGSVTYPVSVRNLGNGRDNFALSYVLWAENATRNNPAYLDRWNVTLSQPAVNSVLASSIATVFVTITAPADAKGGENVSLNVTAISYNDPTKSDMLALKCEVYFDYGFELLDILGGKSHTLGSKDTRVIIGSGSTGLVYSGALFKAATNEFRILVNNTGDGEDSYTVSFWGTGDASGDGEINKGWTQTCTPGGVNALKVPAGRAGEIQFKATYTYPSSDGDAWAEYAMRIQSTKDPTIHIDITGLKITSGAARAIGVKAEWMQKVGTTNVVEFGNNQKTGVPGEEVNYTFRVTNTGNFGDKVYLTHSDPGDWTVTGIPESVQLGTTTATNGESYGKYSEITATVKAPNGAKFGDRLILDIMAVSSEDSSKASILRCITTIGSTVGLDLSAIPMAQNVHAGEEMLYNIIVKNTGNGIADYALSLNKSGLPTGWAAELSKAAMSIPGNSTMTSTLKVTAPAGAAAESKGTVKVIAASGALNKNITVETTVKQAKAGIEISVDKQFEAVRSGTGAQYTFTVKNTQTMRDNITLKASAPLEEWVVKFDGNDTGKLLERTLDLGAGETAAVRLNVISPASALAGTSAVTIVDAVSKKDPAIFARRIVRTNVTAAVAVGISADESKKYADPGSFADYTLRIDNVGTDFDTIDLALSQAYTGWGVTLAQSAIGIPAKSFKEVKLRINAPANAIPGTYMIIEITARSRTDSKVFEKISLNTTVAFRSVDISAKVSETRVSPGEATSYVITAWNNGSGRDQVDVSLDMGGMQGWWNGTLDKASAILEPGTSADFIMSLGVPKDAPSESSITATLKAASHTVASVTKIMSVSAHVYKYVTANVDDDTVPEFAIDVNTTAADGYDTFKEVYSGTRQTVMLYTIDGDADGKKDFVLDTNADGKPDKYWDPDNNTISAISGFVDTDNKSTTPQDFFIDANGDGKPEWLYITGNGTLLPVAAMDVNKDGKSEYLVDVNKDGTYDKYHNPLGAQGNYDLIYYNSETGAYSTSAPVEKTPTQSLMEMLIAYWYIAVLCVVIVVLAAVVVGSRK
jgi:uncharacterized membrane protein